MANNVKSGEIIRLKLFIEQNNLQLIDISNKLSITERSIKNIIYENLPLSGKILRLLHLHYGLSMDWIVSGTGRMMIFEDEINEEQAIYEVNNNDRATRIKAFIDDYMSYATEDEKAWLEIELEIKIRQYRSFKEDYSLK